MTGSSSDHVQGPVLSTPSPKNFISNFTTLNFGRDPENIHLFSPDRLEAARAKSERSKATKNVQEKVQDKLPEKAQELAADSDNLDKGQEPLAEQIREQIREPEQEQVQE